MKINPKVLAEIFPTYGVAPIANVKGASQAIKSGQAEKAPAQYEPFLIGNDYVWNEDAHRYELNDQAVYYFSQAKLFLWVWHDVLTRAITGTSTLVKWIQGDEKYPQGKANAFMGIYKEMTGQDEGGGGGGGTAVAPEDAEHNMDAPEMDRANSEPTNPVFHGVGARGEKVPEPKQMGKDDTLIAQAKKKMGKNGTLPSDDILDLYNQAKELKSNKLMTFIKTIKPLGEGFIKKSALDEVVRQIIKTIVKEASDNWGDRYPNTSGKNEDDAVYDIADKHWGKQKWRIQARKNTEYGSVYQLQFSHPISRFVWKTTDGKWKVMDPKTHKWQDVAETPSAEVKEETATGAVAPIATPFAFKKKVTTEGVPEKEELKAAIRTLTYGDETQMTKDEAKAILQRKGYSSDKITSLETPNELDFPLEEMTTTSGGGGSSAGTSGYNIPGAFSKRGGSEAGVEGSESLGYTLTGIGKKDMQRHADKLLSEGDEADAVTDMHSNHKAAHYEKHYGSTKDKKVNTQKKQTTPKKTIGGVAKVKGKVIHLDEKSK